MRNVVMGCGVALLIALSARSEARPAQENLLRSAATPAILCWTGLASWYGAECKGNYTASGQRYDINGLTCANRDLPMGTKVRITNMANARSVTLTVNDRGPAIASRLVDVSRYAAERLGFLGAGLTVVRLEVIGFPNKSWETAQAPPLAPSRN